ncbi:MAG: PDZ domain-containing protein [FCB group bacterium]|nr:PDZ domain-containing protein [FCB group bacterium]
MSNQTSQGRPVSSFPRTILALTLLAAVLIFASGGKADDSLSAITPAPGNYKITAADGVVRFPFDIFRGDIRFRAEINGHEVYLLLDDGFMWDQLLFWGSPRVDSLGLEYDGEITIGDEGDENAISSRTASGIKIVFPGVEFTDQTAVITPYSSGTSNMWWGSVGQVSATFLKHFVVDINFDDMMITLIEPGKFVYTGKGVAVPWTPMGIGTWQIPGKIGLSGGREISMNFLMDLGYNDQLQIAIGGEHKITVPESSLPTSLGFNIKREETKGFIGRLRHITIGGYEVADVIVGFVAEEYADINFSEAMVGLGLLSRFNLAFDFTRQRLFIEPNQSFDYPYEYDMSGLSIRKGHDEYYNILKVAADSPADKTGLKVGDRITEINGRPAAKYDRDDLLSLFQKPAKVIKVQVLRDGEELKFYFVLKRLI